MSDINKSTLYVIIGILCSLLTIGCQKQVREPSDIVKATMVTDVYYEQGYDAAMVKLDELFDDRENQFAQSAMNEITEGETGVSIYDDIKHLMISQEDAKANSVAINSIEVTENSIDTKNGYNYITGSVKNTGNATIRYYEVVAKFYNVDGEVVNSDYTNSGQDLEPNESRRFDIMSKTTGHGHKYNVYTDNVKFK